MFHVKHFTPKSCNKKRETFYIEARKRRETLHFCYLHKNPMEYQIEK